MLLEGANTMDDAHQESLCRAKELLHSGSFVEAEALLADVIQAMESQLGYDAPELITPLYLYAKSVNKQHAWDTVEPRERGALERALSLAVRLHGAESTRTMVLRETLAGCLRAAGDTAAASEHMAIVVGLAERAYGEGVLLAHALSGHGDMLLELNRFKEALSSYERALGMIHGNGDELAEFGLLFGKGRCLVGLERYGDAVAAMERAYAWFVGRFGDNKRANELRTWLQRARSGEVASKKP